MNRDDEIPRGACPLLAYNNERIHGVSVWLLDLETKRMMLTRSTNIEGLMMRLRRHLEGASPTRLGERLQQFLASTSKSCFGPYWIKNGYATTGYLASMGFVEVPRFTNPSMLPIKKVMIKGKVLQIKHLKTDFTLICAAEPRSLKKVLVSRLTRAIVSINSRDWEDAENVRCFLERFMKTVIENKDKGKQFSTEIVDMPINARHMSYTRIKNEALTRAWLNAKGFKNKPNRFQKESSYAADQKDSSHRFALGR